jgi:hypothetical protein
MVLGAGVGLETTEEFGAAPDPPHASRGSANRRLTRGFSMFIAAQV